MCLTNEVWIREGVLGEWRYISNILGQFYFLIALHQEEDPSMNIA
jgi:hypothetical protein